MDREELAQFCQWFAEYDSEMWDAQIEADAEAGKLDALAAEALVPRLEKDTYIEGDEMLSHEELSAVLDVSIRNIAECRAGKEERRVTVVTDDGEMVRMTQEEYRKNHLPKMPFPKPQTDYNAAEDVATIRFSDKTIADSDEPRDGVVINYDRQGRLVTVEVLNASRMIETFV